MQRSTRFRLELDFERLLANDVSDQLKLISEVER